MHIQWDEQYNTGNDELDKQHKKWVDFYNQLDDAMMGKSSLRLSDTRSIILQEMAEYVDYHFNYEEEFMRSFEYPEVEKHWRMHKTFRDKIYRLHRDHMDGKSVLNREILGMIKNWILDHITKEDMKVIEYRLANHKKEK